MPLCLPIFARLAFGATLLLAMTKKALPSGERWTKLLILVVPSFFDIAPVTGRKNVSWHMEASPKLVHCVEMLHNSVGFSQSLPPIRASVTERSTFRGPIAHTCHSLSAQDRLAKPVQNHGYKFVGDIRFGPRRCARQKA